MKKKTEINWSELPAILLPVIIISFLAGIAGSVFFLNHFYNPVTNISDGAVSIANTYIVFTTFIFVCFSVLSAVAGFHFMSHFSTSKEDQIAHLFKELEQHLKANKDDTGIDFMISCMENPDVKRYLNDKLSAKLNELLNEKQENATKELQDVEEVAKDIA